MSFFAELETPEPAKRGLLGRLKAFTAGFTDSASSAMPIVGREPTDTGDPAVSAEPNGGREPRFKSASKPVNPRQGDHGQPMTMGMRLRRAQEEAEDVAIIGEARNGEWPAKAEIDVAVALAQQEPDDGRASAKSSAAVPMAAVGENISATPAHVADVPADPATESPQERAGVAEPPAPAQATTTPSVDAASQWTSGYDVPPTVRRIGMDVTETSEIAIEGGRPRLVHADSLSFKRVLCQRDEHAALAVTEAARREFIAVELQAGISIVVATQRFHESQLYATYLKDLARADISVHEETLERKFALDTSMMACRDENGCAHCRRPGLFTRDGKVAAGIKGQTLAMELYRPTPEFLACVAARDWRGAEHVWRTSRKTDFANADMTGKTVYEHALYKASQGLIDPRFIDESMCAFEAYRLFPDAHGGSPS